MTTTAPPPDDGAAPPAVLRLDCWPIGAPAGAATQRSRAAQRRQPHRRHPGRADRRLPGVEGSAVAAGQRGQLPHRPGLAAGDHSAGVRHRRAALDDRARLGRRPAARGAGRHRGGAVHHPVRAAAAGQAGRLRDRPARRHPVDHLRPLGHPGARPGHRRRGLRGPVVPRGHPRLVPAAQPRPVCAGHGVPGRDRAGDHDPADHHRDQPRGVRPDAACPTRRPRSPWVRPGGR